MVAGDVGGRPDRVEHLQIGFGSKAQNLFVGLGPTDGAPSIIAAAAAPRTICRRLIRSILEFPKFISKFRAS